MTDEYTDLLERVGERNVEELLKAVVKLDDSRIWEIVQSVEDPTNRLILAHCAFTWFARVQVALGNVNFENLKDGQFYILAAMGKIPHSSLQKLANLSDEEMKQAVEQLLSEEVFEQTDVQLFPDIDISELDQDDE